MCAEEQPTADPSVLKGLVAEKVTNEEIVDHCIPESEQSCFYQAWLDRDAPAMLAIMGSNYGIAFVWDNLRALRDACILEEAFAEAYTSRSGIMGSQLYRIAEHIVMFCDHRKLQSLGDPLPDQESFTIYRGVKNTGIRNIWKRMSWTLDAGIASWFAQCYRTSLSAPDSRPAVFAADVTDEDILLYCRERGEEEVLINPKTMVRKPRRLKTLPRVKDPRTNAVD